MTIHNDLLPTYRFAGSHREIGRQYGAACREPIRKHLFMALERIRARSGWTVGDAIDQALTYRAVVMQHTPFFDDELQGLADGSGLSLGEAYLLQLRAELNPSTAIAEETPECTTFAVGSTGSAGGGIFAGQVADLPVAYRDLGVLVELRTPEQPAILMYTPAGQISYIGINSAGLACFANYLHCEGWGMGVPRYFLSRLAMRCTSVAQAMDRVRAVPRASSRNLLMADASGVIVDLETTVTEDAVVLPEQGVLAHANHYMAPTMLQHERGSQDFLRNSKLRHARMNQLLQQGRGQHTLDTLQAITCDRAGAPDCISRSENDGEDGVMSVAAVIASPTLRQLSAAKGAPHCHQFQAFGFSAQGAE